VVPTVRKFSLRANHASPFGLHSTLDSQLLSPSIKEGPRIFLRDSVSNVKIFTVNTPTGVIPSVSWEDSGNGKPFPKRLDDLQDIDTHPVHYAGSDPDTWTWLTVAMTPLKARLFHLALPHNWHTSKGINTRKLSVLRHLPG
jgi:hypothetical protein